MLEDKFIQLGKYPVGPAVYIYLYNFFYMYIMNTLKYVYKNICSTYVVNSSLPQNVLKKYKRTVALTFKIARVKAHCVPSHFYN